MQKCRWETEVLIRGKGKYEAGGRKTKEMRKEGPCRKQQLHPALRKEGVLRMQNRSGSVRLPEMERSQ
jgi:hypothetical protein